MTRSMNGCADVTEPYSSTPAAPPPDPDVAIGKLLIVNRGEVRDALRRHVSRLGLAPLEWRGIAADLAWRGMALNQYWTEPCARAGPGDPPWVAERLAEGRTVWRLATDHRPLRQIAAIASEAIVDCLRWEADRRGDAETRAGARLALRHARHRAVVRFMLAHRCILENEEAARSVASLDVPDDVPFGEPTVVQVGGGARWLVCNSLSEVAAAGRELGNCLGGVRHDALGHHGRAALAGTSRF